MGLPDFLSLCRGIAVALLPLAYTPSALACACCTNQASATSPRLRWIPASSMRLKACASPARRRCSRAKATSKVSGASRRLRGATSRRKMARTTGWCSRSATGSATPARCRWPVRTRSRCSRSIRAIAPTGVRGRRCTRNGNSLRPASGSGVFRPGIAPRQMLTLILQGGGNSCTSAYDFSHWTLVMQGPKANYTLFGDLVTTK